MMTWINAQPAEHVEAATALFAEHSDVTEHYLALAGSDRHYALWLWLVDLQLETLPGRRPELAWDWTAAYESGWSPRNAAFYAWASTERPAQSPSCVIQPSCPVTVLK
jgi:hypothetical protein